jgi:hypothetical protein
MRARRAAVHVSRSATVTRYFSDLKLPTFMRQLGAAHTQGGNIYMARMCAL